MGLELYRTYVRLIKRQQSQKFEGENRIELPAGLG